MLTLFSFSAISYNHNTQRACDHSSFAANFYSLPWWLYGFEPHGPDAPPSVPTISFDSFPHRQRYLTLQITVFLVTGSVWCSTAAAQLETYHGLGSHPDAMTPMLEHESEGVSTPDSPDSASPPVSTSSPSTEGSMPLLQQRPPIPHHSITSPPLADMTASSTPLGAINAARRPGPPQPTLSGRGSALPQDLAAKLKAFTMGRQGAPPVPGLRTSNLAQGPSRAPAPSPASPSPSLGPGGIPAGFVRPPGLRPMPGATASSPAIANKSSLAAKRGMQLPSGLPGTQPPPPGGKKRPGLSLSQMTGGSGAEVPGQSAQKSGGSESLMDKYSDFIDKETGTLKFKGKAIITNHGVEFASGKTFSISLDEVDTLDELGKGNYGTVYKVRHSRPRIRRPGMGLAGNKASTQTAINHEESPVSTGGSSGVVMAMKEIRLELDDAKFAAIIMELDILHRCISPFIVDFYGAFFQEGAVYILSLIHISEPTRPY